MNFIKKSLNIRNFPAAAMGILGFLIVLACTYSFGPGISHDSAAYIYTAKSLLAGKGYEYFGYVSPFVQWPPLFPTLLALPGIIGIDPVTASKYINAVVFGLIVYLAGIWLNRHLKNGWLAGLGTAVILLAAPLIYASGYVWTEPLFVLLFLVFMFEFEKFIKLQHYPALIKASITVAIACLDRYMGITIIFTGCLFLLFQRKKPVKRFMDIFLFGFISSFPTVIWIIRNYIVSSTLVGLRTPASVTLYQNIVRTVKTVVLWLLPYKSLHNVPALLQAVSICLVVLTTAGLLVMVYRKSRDSQNGDISRWFKDNGLPTAVLTAFIVIYAAYMIASATSVAFDAIGDRYLLPIYIPVFFVIFLVLDCIAFLVPKSTGSKTAVYILIAALSLWLVYPLAGTFTAVESRLEKGMPNSYNAGSWRNSKLVSYLQQSKPEYVVYSNYPDAIYVLAGIEAKYTPKRAGLPEFYGLEKFEQRVKEDGGAYIAWFDRGAARTIYNAKELKEYFDLELKEKLEDGSLYLIRPRS